MNLTDKASYLLVSGRRCILNTDLDGLVAGALLHEFLDWTIVGWCDCRGRSTDRVWLDSDLVDLDDVVFVDMHVRHPSVPSIEQHFAAPDSSTAAALLANPNKINPNHASPYRSRSGRQDYQRKYPFGTANLVLALLERQLGHIDIDLNAALGGSDSSSPRIGDLFLRCDDTAGNTIKYASNADDWWLWLQEIGGSLTRRIATRAGDLRRTQSYEGLLETLHRPLSAVLGRPGVRGTSRYGWIDRSHADFADGLEDGRIDPSVLSLIDELFLQFGDGAPRIPKNHTMIDASRGARTSWSEATSLLLRSDLFSYTFVNMGRNGLSYTLFESPHLPTGPGRGYL